MHHHQGFKGCLKEWDFKAVSLCCVGAWKLQRPLPPKFGCKKQEKAALSFPPPTRSSPSLYCRGYRWCASVVRNRSRREGEEEEEEEEVGGRGKAETRMSGNP